MATITNTAEGPRGVLLADGTTHYVEPGATVDLDVAKGHDLYDGLVEGEGGDDGDKPLSQMNKAELLATAEAEGVAIEDGATNAAIKQAIEAARAA